MGLAGIWGLVATLLTYLLASLANPSSYCSVQYSAPRFARSTSFFQPGSIARSARLLLYTFVYNASFSDGIWCIICSNKTIKVLIHAMIGEGTGMDLFIFRLGIEFLFHYGHFVVVKKKG